MEKVENIRVFPLTKPAGNIVANFQFKYGDLIVKGKVCSGKNGNFIILPSHSYEKNGKTVWTNEVYFLSKDNKTQLQEDVLKALETAGTSQGEAVGPIDQSADQNIPF